MLSTPASATTMPHPTLPSIYIADFDSATSSVTYVINFETGIAQMYVPFQKAASHVRQSSMF